MNDNAGARLTAELVDLLNVRYLGSAEVNFQGELTPEQFDPGRQTAYIFEGDSQRQPHGRVFGGQVLAQALMAAGRTVEQALAGGPTRPVHSLHAYFVRPGDDTQPIRFSVELMRDGRSFSTRRTHAMQGGEVLLTMTASFQEPAGGLDHQDPMPSAPDPETIPTFADSMAEVRGTPAEFFVQSRAFDVRTVEGPIHLHPGRQHANRQKVWVKAWAPLPDDPLLHAAFLTYASDYVMLEPVLRRHGLSWTHPRLRAAASLDHAMWFHRPVRADEWMLFAQMTPSAVGGRGLGISRVFSTDGDLVASIAQEGMLRVAD